MQEVRVFQIKLSLHLWFVFFDLYSVLVDRLSLLFKVCDCAGGFYPVLLALDECLRCVVEVVDVLDLVRLSSTIVRVMFCCDFELLLTFSCRFTRSQAALI